MKIALLVFLCLFVFAIPLSGLGLSRKSRKIEAAFAGREPLNPARFYEKYFQAQGISSEVVFGVRSILEEELAADLSRLQDSDDFSKNLSFFWDYDSLADVEIVCRLEEYFGITISDAEAEQSKTVGDIVNLVQSKLNAKPNEASV